MGCSSYGGTQITQAQAEQLWTANGGPAAAAPIAGAIAAAESSLYTGAVNSCDPNGGSFGVWQINNAWAPQLAAAGITNWQTDANANAQAAVYVFTHPAAWMTSPWQAWGTYNGNNYLAFLTTKGNTTTPSGGAAPTLPAPAGGAAPALASFVPTALSPQVTTLLLVGVAAFVLLALLGKRASS